MSPGFGDMGSQAPKISHSDFADYFAISATLEIEAYIRLRYKPKSLLLYLIPR
jgi:hypothetical protein